MLYLIERRVGGTWQLIAAAQNAFWHAEVDMIQTFYFPSTLHELSENDLIRLVVFKPSGTNHGANAAITARLENYTRKSFRISYIEQ